MGRSQAEMIPPFFALDPPWKQGDARRWMTSESACFGAGSPPERWAAPKSFTYKTYPKNFVQAVEKAEPLPEWPMFPTGDDNVYDGDNVCKPFPTEADLAGATGGSLLKAFEAAVRGDPTMPSSTTSISGVPPRPAPCVNHSPSLHATGTPFTRTKCSPCVWASTYSREADRRARAATRRTRPRPDPIDLRRPDNRLEELTQLLERRLTNSPQLAPRELQNYICVVVDQVLDDDFRFRFRGQELAQSLYGVGESTAVRHSFMYGYAMLFE